MARPKQPITRDPDKIISARARIAPVDQTVILCKMSDGTIVKPLGNGVLSIGYLFDKREVIVTSTGLRVADATGRMQAQSLDTSVSLYKTMLTDEEAKKLKVGIAEAYAFRWVNAHPRRQSEVRVREWYPVSKKSGDVFAPAAYGDQTDDQWHMGDNILYKQTSETHKRVSADLKYYNDPARHMEEQAQRNRESALQNGAKDYSQTIEASPRDAVTIGTE